MWGFGPIFAVDFTSFSNFDHASGTKSRFATSGLIGLGFFDFEPRVFVMTVNPWDVLEPDGAETEPEKLYVSIGRALSEWEWTEQQLAHFFGFFCGGDDPFAVRRAYGSVITFRGRADMLRSAAEAYFHAKPGHKMKDRFDGLLKLAGNYSPRRNEIAHGLVTVAYFMFENEEGLQKASIEASLRAMRWLLCPPEYATNKHTLMPMGDDEIFRYRRKYAYSCKEVDHYGQQFREIRNDLWKLMLDWSREYPDADILPPV